MTGHTAIADRPPIEARAQELYEWVRAKQRSGQRVGLVPTMGALHAGHLSLVRRSVQECDATVVTIFVNPLQFGPREDFAKYPRMLDKDLTALAPAGIDLVFAPEVEEMYPPGFVTHVEVEGVTDRWEGEFRPGHLRGVATVVLKLLQIAPADRVYFGQKDYQQTVVVRKMVADLNLPMEIVVCPTVRESDGLALSSRNVFLSKDERQWALVLSRSVRLARDLFTRGERDGKKIVQAMQEMLATEPQVQIDYATVADRATLAPLERIEHGGVALVAARVGQTRLIDNEILGDQR